MKQLTYLFLICTFLVSCSPTSNIITSKSEAEKRGIYRTPQPKKAVAKTTSKVRNGSYGQPMASTNTQPIATRSTQQVAARKAAAETPKKTSSDAVLNESNADDYDVAGDNSSYVVKQLINTAEANLGAGYHTGGTNPNTGFDCSGLMFSTFQKFDITLPRSSNDMSKIGRKLGEDEIQKGDLIFFRTNGRSVINHVGMVTEVTDGEIKFIHSSTQKGVIISSTKEPYYGRTFAQCNRIIVNL